VVDANGDQFVLWNGQDGNLYYAEWNNTSLSWSGWNIVAGQGPLNSKPAATLVGTTIQAYWRGADLNVWTAKATLTGPAVGAWTGPTSLGDGPLPSS